MYKQLIYCSKLLPEHDIKEVYSILSSARKNNPELGLSGYLVYSDNAFLQVLEGFKAPLDSLFEKIKQDSRHTDIKIIHEEDVKYLDFENWAMGFANLVEDLGSELKQYMQEISQLESFDPHKLTPEQAKKFLDLFARRSS